MQKKKINFLDTCLWKYDIGTQSFAFVVYWHTRRLNTLPYWVGGFFHLLKSSTYHFDLSWFFHKRKSSWVFCCSLFYITFKHIQNGSSQRNILNLWNKHWLSISFTLSYCAKVLSEPKIGIDIVLNCVSSRNIFVVKNLNITDFNIHISWLHCPTAFFGAA